MSQQPYGSGQPGHPGQQPGQPGQPQPGQPVGYPPPGQQGYPQQGGYPQPGQPPAPGYGGYQGSQGSPGSPPRPSNSHSGNPLDHPATLAPILQILGYVVAVLGVVGGFFAFAIDGYPGSFKFVTFAATAVAGLGFGGVLIGLAALLKSRTT